MKLISYAAPTDASETRIASLLDGGRAIDLAAAYRTLLLRRGVDPKAARRIAGVLLSGDMVEFIEGGSASMQAAQEAQKWVEDQLRGDPSATVEGLLTTANLQVLSPVPHPPFLRDFLAFETHLTNLFPRLGREIPPFWYEMPVYYKGNTASIAGPDDNVPLPPYEDEVDMEFEIGIVIGRGGRNISKEQAFDHIFGFTIYNDFSARIIQGKEMSVGLGPAKSKDFAKAHVFGPCLVTKDEIPDFYNLRMVSRVNGEVWCDSNTSTMHWKVEDLIAQASLGEDLRPGELIGSGTVGWGSGMERDRALKPGDVVELEVQGLGLLRNTVVANQDA